MCFLRTPQSFVAAVVAVGLLGSGITLAGTDRALTTENGVEAECSLAIDPTDEDHIVVVGHDYQTFDRLARFTSHDGGDTWSSLYFDDDGIAGYVRSDPSVSFAPNGDQFIAYQVATFNPHTLVCAKQEAGDTSLVVTIVEDGPLPRDVPGILDKPYVTCGPKPGGEGYNVYICYWRADTGGSDPGLYVAVSQDSGASFDLIPVDLSPGFTTGDPSFGHCAVDDDGNLLIVWRHLSSTGSDVRMSYSETGGATFVREGVLVALSTVGKICVPAQPGRKIHVVPSIAVNNANTNHPGRIFVAFTESFDSSGNSLDSDIALTYSDDLGETWSSPRIVHRSDANSQFLPWISVDRTNGYVGVAFYDARGDVTGNNPGCSSGDGCDSTDCKNELVHAWVSVSTDGGDSWYERRISDRPSDQSGYRTDAAANYAEYLGVACADGKVHVAWSEAPEDDITDLDYVYDNLTYSEIINPAVFEVPSTSYSTIASALAAASAGDTVTVVSAVTSGPITLPANIQLVIAASGCAIDANGADDGITIPPRYWIKAPISLGDLTITDFTSSGIRIDGGRTFVPSVFHSTGGVIEGNDSGANGVYVSSRLPGGNRFAAPRVNFNSLAISQLTNAGVLSDSAFVTMSAANISGTRAGVIGLASEFIVDNLEIHDFVDTGIVGVRSDFTLSECTIEDGLYGMCMDNSTGEIAGSRLQGLSDGGICIESYGASYPFSIQGTVVASTDEPATGATGIKVNAPPVADGIVLASNTVAGWDKGVKIVPGDPNDCRDDPGPPTRPFCPLGFVKRCCETQAGWRWICRNASEYGCGTTLLGGGTYDVHHNLVVGAESVGIDCSNVPGTLNCNIAWTANDSIGAYAGIDSVTGGANLSLDPLLCASHDETVQELTLRIDSPASEGNSSCGHVGALPVECAWDTLERTTTVAVGTEFRVLEDLVVPVGDSLTLEHGVAALFDTTDESESGLDQDKIELKVSGTLEVDGTSGDRVVFRSAEAAPDEGDWWGIYVNGGTVNMNYADVRHADWGIAHVSAAAGLIENSLFSENSLTDIKSGNSSANLTIRENDLTIGGGYGMDIAVADSVVRNTLVGDGDTVIGIYCATSNDSAASGIARNELSAITEGTGIELGAGISDLVANIVDHGIVGIKVTGGTHDLGTTSSGSDNIVGGASTALLVSRGVPGQCANTTPMDVVLKNNQFLNYTDGLVTVKAPNYTYAPVDAGLGVSGSNRGLNQFINDEPPEIGETFRAIVNTTSACDTLLARANFFGLYAGSIVGKVDTTGSLATQPASAIVATEPTPSLAPSIRIRGAFPNPTTGHIRIELDVSGDRLEAEIQVLDILGRLVRRMSAGGLSTGINRVEWDGTDEQASRVSNGIYFVRVRYADTVISSTRIVMAR